jgi:prevent-host-death family protein
MKKNRIVNLYEAKTHLSRLVERAALGDEIVIAKAGRPMARLVSLKRTASARRPGLWKGKLVIHPDFDDPLPEEILAAFEGREA